MNEGGVLVRREFNDEDLEVIKYLGKGCSGTVDLVRHRETGELMALKVQLGTIIHVYIQ